MQCCSAYKPYNQRSMSSNSHKVTEFWRPAAHLFAELLQEAGHNLLLLHLAGFQLRSGLARSQQGVGPPPRLICCSRIRLPHHNVESSSADTHVQCRLMYNSINRRNFVHDKAYGVSGTVVRTGHMVGQHTCRLAIVACRSSKMASICFNSSCLSCTI